MSNSYEDWNTTTAEGMISTVVIEIQEDPTVLVSDVFMPELGLDPEKFPEKVHPHKEKFVRAVPYAVVAEQLTRLGWTRAGTP